MEFEHGQGACGETFDAGTDESHQKLRGKTTEASPGPRASETIPMVHLPPPRKPGRRTRRHKCQREGCGRFFRRHKPSHALCPLCRSDVKASVQVERRAGSESQAVTQDVRRRNLLAERRIDALFLAWKRGELPSGVQVAVQNDRQVILRIEKKSYTRYLQKGEVPPVRLKATGT